MTTGNMAVGWAMVRYHDTRAWLYVGRDTEATEENKFGLVFCTMLGYIDGEVRVCYISALR